MQRFPLRFLAPNAITCASITLGMISLQQSMVGEYVTAAWLIIMCVLFDKADGTVARLMHATSTFGIQMDSFSDFLTFGIAPSFLVYSMLMNSQTLFATHPVFKWALMVSVIIYTLAASLRLAKFNVLTEKIGSKYFLGFPTTLCGALVGCYILTGAKYAWPILHIQLLPAIMAVLAILMVTNLKLPKMNLPETGIPRVFMIASFVSVYLCGFSWHFPEFLLFMGLLFVGGAMIYSAIHLRDLTPISPVEQPSHHNHPA